MAKKTKTTKTVSDETLERLRTRVQSKLLTEAIERECDQAIREEAKTLVNSKEFKKAIADEVRPLIMDAFKRKKGEFIKEIEKQMASMVKNVSFGCY